MSHIHTTPKSTSESQAQITHLLTAPEPARGFEIEDAGLKKLAFSISFSFALYPAV